MQTNLNGLKRSYNRLVLSYLWVVARAWIATAGMLLVAVIGLVHNGLLTIVDYWPKTRPMVLPLAKAAHVALRVVDGWLPSELSFEANVIDVYLDQYAEPEEEDYYESLSDYGEGEPEEEEDPPSVAATQTVVYAGDLGAEVARRLRDGEVTHG